MIRAPLVFPGMRVGLLGGSFNPAHRGHLHASRIALARLGLDRVWWLVTPQNPLKPRAGMAELGARAARARNVARDPRLVVTAIEAELGTRFTVDTLAALRRRFPGVRFVWLMGADNLATFHRWQRWREILRLVPVAVIARPGTVVAAGLSRAAQAARPWRRLEEEASALARLPPPAWVILHGPLDATSASAIRASGAWP